MYEKILKYVALGVAILGVFLFVLTLNITEKRKDAARKAAENPTYFKNFTLTGLDGETFTQEDLKTAKVTVLNGWAPWCGPCTGEMPDLQALSEAYADKGLQVVGIVADYYYSADKEGKYDAEIKDAVQATGVTYPILVSDAAFMKEPFLMMNSSFPGTWAIDSEGNVLGFVSGSKSEAAWTELFDRWLEEAEK